MSEKQKITEQNKEKILVQCDHCKEIQKLPYMIDHSFFYLCGKCDEKNTSLTLQIKNLSRLKRIRRKIQVELKKDFSLDEVLNLMFDEYENGRLLCKKCYQKTEKNYRRDPLI